MAFADWVCVGRCGGVAGGNVVCGARWGDGMRWRVMGEALEVWALCRGDAGVKRERVR